MEIWNYVNMEFRSNMEYGIVIWNSESRDGDISIQEWRPEWNEE